MGNLIFNFIENHVSELIFFLFKIGESMLEPSVRLYLYEGVCLSIFKSPNGTEQCAAQEIAQDFENLQTQVQDEASKYLVIYKILMNAPALFLGFFCGSWSDIIGRRIPVLLALIATTTAVFLYAMSTWIEIEGAPAIPLVLFGALIRGGVGRSAVITMALYSLVCDHSNQQNRTKKIGRLLSMSYFGYFIGSLIVARLLESYGFGFIFLFVFIVDLFSIIIALYFMEKDMKNTSVDIENGETTKNASCGMASENNTEKKDNFDINEKKCENSDEDEKLSKKMMPFKLSHVVSSVKVLTSQRPNRNRLNLLIFLFILFANQTCRSGESDVTLLFAEVPPLSWRKSMYAYLLATDYALLGLTVLLILPFLIKFFKFTDCKLIMLGLSFRILRLLILSISKSTFEVFFSTIIGAPSALIISCCKASISKLVEENERGKVFALISCAETVAILAGSIIFVSVYNSTKNFFAGSVFVFEALFFACLLFLIYLVGKDLNAASEYNEMNNANVGDNNNNMPQCPSFEPQKFPSTNVEETLNKVTPPLNDQINKENDLMLQRRSNNPFYNMDSSH